jgi:YVTN family beta-propeller protein
VNVRRLGIALSVGVIVASAVSVSSAGAVPAPAPTIAFVSDWGCDAQGTTVTPFDVLAKTVEAPITIGPANTGPFFDAITPDGKTVYEGRENIGDVVAIDVATRRVTATIPIPGTGPGLPGAVEELAVAPNGQTVYVVTGEADTVDRIRVATNTLGTPINFAGPTGGVAITPNGATMYVTDYLHNKVTPVSLPGGTLGTPIPVKGRPGNIVITPNGKTAYTADGNNTVTPITLATATVDAEIPVGNSPDGLAVTPDGKTVYVANAGSGWVTPITTATNTQRAIILTGIGRLPTGIAVGPAGKTLYVAEQNSENPGLVTPITISSGAVGASISDVGPCPFWIAITPDQPPVAAFTTTVRKHGTASSVNASASYPQSTAIAKYAWSWGDGKTTTTTKPTATHTYAKAGSFTVTLTLTDSAGTSTTQVFTGQTMSRNGSSIARAAKTISVG